MTLSRDTILPLGLVFAILVASTMGADWTPWIEGLFGIVAFLMIFFSRHSSVIGTSWRDPHRWFAVFFVFIVFISTFSTNLYASLRGVVYIFVGYIFFRAAAALLQQYVRPILTWVHLIASLGALWALIDQIRMHLDRTEGLLHNANALGAFLVLALPTGIYISTTMRGWRRVFAWVGVAFLILALLLSFSLTAIFGLIISGIIVGIPVWRRMSLSSKRLGRIILWAVAALVSFAILGIGLRSIELKSIRSGVRLDQVITQVHFQSSFQQRWRFLESTTLMIADRPWAGFGLGSYQGTFPRYASTVFELPRYAHNAYFELAAEAGIPAAVIFLVLFLVIAKRIYQRWSNPDVFPGQRWITWAVLASAVGAFVDFGWHFPAVWILFWVFVGISIGPSSGKQRSIVDNFSHALLLIFGLVVLVRGLGVAYAYTPFQRAERVLAQGDPELAASYFLRGLQYDPNPYYDGRYALSVWMRARGDIPALEDAQQHVDHMIRWDPFDYFAYQLRARIAFSQKNNKEAEIAMQKAIFFDHYFHLDIVSEYANFLIVEKRYQDARSLLDNALAANGGNLWSANPYFAADIALIRNQRAQVQAALQKRK